MTAQELLIPRMLVTSDYPESPFKIGDILTFDGIVWGCNEPQKFVREPGKYLHLFKPLNWWEHRKLEDMPKKVISNRQIDKGIVRDVEKWYLDERLVFFDSMKKQYCSFIDWDSENCYLPID